MSKKVRNIFTFVLLLSCILFPCVKADAKGTSTSYEFYVDYSEPSTDGYNGYINVMYQTDGGYRLYTYFWTIHLNGDTDYSTNQNLWVVASVNRGSLGLSVVSNLNSNETTADSGATFTLACYDWNDNLHILNTGLALASPLPILTEDYSGTPIVGYSYKGDCIISASSGLKDVPIPEIYWNNSVDSYWLNEKLNQLLSSLGNVNGNVVNIMNQIEAIWNQNNYTNQKLEALERLSNQIKAEQEESNTWLEKIFNWLKESPEQEKQEAQTQGGNSVAEGTNAIEDKGQGFSDSMTGLINSMSYNGTECSWTFPTVKLPAISGVMEERVLIQNQDIDFGFWINSIPSNIMLLIRSVLTMALIVYCFKELYDTISYVLTLRGSNNE